MKVHVSNNSGFYEWYTPSYIIDAARLTMETIDLDPASSVEANKTVRASKIYTKETNGLDKKWFGNIWLNPPYNKIITQFIDKLNQEINNINQACVLVNNATETKWFNKLIKNTSRICFTYRRIKFNTIEGSKKGTPLQGQAIVYIGRSPDKFEYNFKEIGFICKII